MHRIRDGNISKPFPNIVMMVLKENVTESSLSDIPEQAMREFLAIVRQRLIEMRRKK